MPPSSSRRFEKYKIFQKLAPPEHYNDADGWALLLEQALPIHLQQHSEPASLPSLDATDIAEVLLAAQETRRGGVDVLYHLCINRERWSAAVWLIKRVVEQFPVPPQSANWSSITARNWDMAGILDKVSTDPIDFPLAIPGSKSVEAQTLQELTSNKATQSGRRQNLQHGALGQVWRSLGAMILAGDSGSIKPEVLEIIAYLHHKEIMPQSIYQYTPNKDPLALQQPPTLPLLSSRILTSLSDAAWRAHEKLIVHEAAARGGEYADIRPEIPGSVYRVHVAGLRAEVWMELILWSCLHGGWILQGAEILRDMSQFGGSRTWKAVSHLAHQRQLESNGTQAKQDWEYWDYLFKTTAASSRDDVTAPSASVDRTVSSEVVNVFIDSLINNVGLHEIGSVPHHRLLMDLLLRMKALLDRSELLPSSGSWDAIILRLLDNSTVSIVERISLMTRLLDASPPLASMHHRRHRSELPSHLLDPNAAIQGLLLTALRAQIAFGNFIGALTIFQRLQGRIDSDRQHSLQNFFQGTLKSLTKDQMFTSNFSGIDYPNLNLQIPPMTLGSFITLAVESKAYEFARWLLYSTDVDGPVIPPELNSDPHIQPALFRLAIETDDFDLLKRIRQLPVSGNAHLSVLDTQISAMHWSSAIRVLRHIDQQRARKWGVSNLANLARVMMRLFCDAEDAEQASDLMSVKKLFYQMFWGAMSEQKARNTTDRDATIDLKSLLAVLTAVNTQWARFCEQVQASHGYRKFGLPIASFNIVLEGVLAVHGSEAGRRLLNTFGPFETLHQPISGENRIVVNMAAEHDEKKELVMHGVLSPNLTTLMLIFERAVLDAQQCLDKSKTAEPALETASDLVDFRDTILWTVKCMLRLPRTEPNVVEQLAQKLTNHGMGDLRTEVMNLASTTMDRLGYEEQEVDAAGTQRSTAGVEEHTHG